jgi:hypothetical protein
MGIAAPITAGFVMLVLLVVGKVWDFLTAKKEQKLAVARASLVLDEDEDMGQLSSSKSKKNAPHSKAAIKLALARAALLGHASNSELDSLLSSKKTKKVALDAFVYRANDPAEAFYYIKSGAFKIVDSQSGVESRKSEGQLIGHTDFLSKTERTESAQCVSVGSEGKAVLVAFPRSALLYILGKRQGFAYDSDSDSESDSDAEEDEAESKRGEEEAAHSHSVIQLDDIFCGSGRRHVY